MSRVPWLKPIVAGMVLVLMAPSSDAGAGRTSPPESSTTGPAVIVCDEQITVYVREAATRYGVREELITAIIAVESHFDPNAVSRKGATGLMQLMPRTAALMGVRDRLDPPQNIDGGVRHLRTLMDRFGNNLPLVLAAYNAGDGAVASWGGIPPYPETRRFVVRVLRRLGDKHPLKTVLAQSAPHRERGRGRKSPRSLAAAVPVSSRETVARAIVAGEGPDAAPRRPYGAIAEEVAAALSPPAPPIAVPDGAPGPGTRTIVQAP